MADIFDVVSDGTRRRLLRVLLDHSRLHGEVSVSQLVAELELSQPTVSKHLKVLRDHGLVAVREEGQHRYYRVDAEPLAELEEWLAPFRGIRPGDARVQTIVDSAAPSEAWAAVTAAADSLGRAAATLSYAARRGAEQWQLGVDVLERRVGLGYRKTADGVSRFVDRLPFS